AQAMRTAAHVAEYVGVGKRVVVDQDRVGTRDAGDVETNLQRGDDAAVPRLSRRLVDAHNLVVVGRDVERPHVYGRIAVRLVASRDEKLVSGRERHGVTLL